MAGAKQRVEQQPDLAARAGAEFDDLGIGADALGHLARVAAQQRELGARRVVLGQLADALEQRRTGGVVEVLRGDRARALRQRGQQVAREVAARRRRVADHRQHDGTEIGRRAQRQGTHASCASRSPLNCQRAAGGKKLR